MSMYCLLKSSATKRLSILFPYILDGVFQIVFGALDSRVAEKPLQLRGFLGSVEELAGERMAKGVGGGY